jgi:hypothetical protein
VFAFRQDEVVEVGAAVAADLSEDYTVFGEEALFVESEKICGMRRERDMVALLEQLRDKTFRKPC